MNQSEKHRIAWIKAVRMVSRLRPAPDELTNHQALLALHRHFIHGEDIDQLCKDFLRPEQNPTIIQKLVATHEGKESSRRKDVRRIFANFMKEIGRGSPFQEYAGKPGSRGGVQHGSTSSARAFLPSLGGAMRGSNLRTPIKRKGKVSRTKRKARDSF